MRAFLIGQRSSKGEKIHAHVILLQLVRELANIFLNLFFCLIMLSTTVFDCLRYESQIFGNFVLALRLTMARKFGTVG